jgi:hypothetical protein
VSGLDPIQLILSPAFWLCALLAFVTVGGLGVLITLRGRARLKAAPAPTTPAPRPPLTPADPVIPDPSATHSSETSAPDNPDEILHPDVEPPASMATPRAATPRARREQPAPSTVPDPATIPGLDRPFIHTEALDDDEEAETPTVIIERAPRPKPPEDT